jgi:hypothetical protein
MKVEKGHILEISVVIQFGDLTSLLRNKMPKIGIYEKNASFIYGCEKWFLNLRQEHTFQDLENVAGKYLDVCGMK